MITDNAFASFGPLAFAVIAIWATVSIVLYVWLLWALASLFPYLGLPKSHGWIPIFNQWRVLERGGYPGWLVLLGIVPGLGIFVFVMWVLAVNRINREHGESVGMTVLGAIIPQVWAILLTNHLRDRGFLGASQGGGGGTTVEASASAWPQPASAPTDIPASWAPPMLSPSLPGPADPEQRQVSGTSDADSSSNPWSLGGTIADNFERLAGEPLPARDASFGSVEARPFSWPEPTASGPAAQSAENLPEHSGQRSQSSRYVPGSEQPIEDDDEIGATIVTGGTVAPIAAEDEIDHTMVVVRKKRWILELPDGTELELIGDDIVIGRRPVAIDNSTTLLIPDSSRTLSKSHARLRRSEERWTIEDLNSTNGVFVFDEAGEQVEVTPGTELPASEQLLIGTLDMRLRELS
ncbi:MAG: FHA domain-containing protein [Leucobacter sp.]